eukprot:scaffold16243_cov59-Phaeocystis_antarctica.AAC.4
MLLRLAAADRLRERARCLLELELDRVHGRHEALGHVLGLQLLVRHDLTDSGGLLLRLHPRAHHGAARVVARLDEEADAAIGLPDEGAGGHAGDLVDVGCGLELLARHVLGHLARLVEDLAHHPDGHLALGHEAHLGLGPGRRLDLGRRLLHDLGLVLAAHLVEERALALLVVRVLHPQLHLVHGARERGVPAGDAAEAVELGAAELEDGGAVVPGASREDGCRAVGGQLDLHALGRVVPGGRRTLAQAPEPLQVRAVNVDRLEALDGVRVDAARLPPRADGRGHAAPAQASALAHLNLHDKVAAGGVAELLDLAQQRVRVIELRRALVLQQEHVVTAPVGHGLGRAHLGAGHRLAEGEYPARLLPRLLGPLLHLRLHGAQVAVPDERVHEDLQGKLLEEDARADVDHLGDDGARDAEHQAGRRLGRRLRPVEEREDGELGVEDDEQAHPAHRALEGQRGEDEEDHGDVVCAEHDDHLGADDLPHHGVGAAAGEPLMPRGEELDVGLAVVVGEAELKDDDHEEEPREGDDVLVGAHVLQRGDELLEGHHLGQVDLHRA